MMMRGCTNRAIGVVGTIFMMMEGHRDGGQDKKEQEDGS
jgi:hypothetical protein